MPIYEYRCSSCGFQKEYLHKVSDPVLSICPECGKETFNKMLTAAGFQLKGGGWYATDFKNSGKPKTAALNGAADKSGSSDSGSSDAGEKKTETKPAASDSTSAAKSDTSKANATKSE